MAELTTAQRLAAYRDELREAGFDAMQVVDLVQSAAPALVEDVEVQADLDDPGMSIGEVRVHLKPVLDQDDLHSVAGRAREIVHKAAEK